MPDLLGLGANLIDAINNTRRIEDVYLNGVALDRAAMLREFQRKRSSRPVSRFSADLRTLRMKETADDPTLCERRNRSAALLRNDRVGPGGRGAARRRCPRCHGADTGSHPGGCTCAGD